MYSLLKMSPSFCTSAIATRLAPPNTFSYSRYTFMYGCVSGTILLKPASTTRREAEAAKSSVSAPKTTSQRLAVVEDEAGDALDEPLRAFIAGLRGAEGSALRARPLSPSSSTASARAQHRPWRRRACCRVASGWNDLPVVAARRAPCPRRPRARCAPSGSFVAADERRGRGVVDLLPGLARVGGAVDAAAQAEGDHGAVVGRDGRRRASPCTGEGTRRPGLARSRRRARMVPASPRIIRRPSPSFDDARSGACRRRSPCAHSRSCRRRSVS